jgi:hypothetical protein
VIAELRHDEDGPTGEHQKKHEPCEDFPAVFALLHVQHPVNPSLHPAVRRASGSRLQNLNAFVVAFTHQATACL